jgi:hypothetical protein
MLRSGKERVSDFGRVWLELEDHLAQRRTRMYITTAVLVGLVVFGLGTFIAATGGSDAIGGICVMLFMVAVFASIFFFGARQRLQRIQAKIDFAKGVTDALADDYHPARKIHYYMDLRPYDAEDKKYWSGRSMHGNSKYKYLDRWFRQKFWLIDGTRVVVERKADHKVRKGSLIRHKRRVYVKVYPSEKTFGPGPWQGDDDLEMMVKQAVNDSFHDPPEVLRIRRQGPRDHVGIALTQLDAPILPKEVVALVESILLYLQMKR